MGLETIIDGNTGVVAGSAVGGSGVLATIIGLFFKSHAQQRQTTWRRIDEIKKKVDAVEDNMRDRMEAVKEKLTDEMSIHAIEDLKTFVTKEDNLRDIKAIKEDHIRDLATMHANHENLRSFIETKFSEQTSMIIGILQRSHG